MGQTVQVSEFSHQHTVDGRNPANQLRLVVYPIIYKVYISQVVVSDFFHQQKHHQQLASQRFPSCATPPRLHSALDPMVTSCKVCQAGSPFPTPIFNAWLNGTEFIQTHPKQCEMSRKQTHKKMAVFYISNNLQKRTHIFHLMHLERFFEYEPTYMRAAIHMNP